MAVAVSGLLAFRAMVPQSHLLPSNEICGGYLQTVGTIYAVLLAFVVFVVWTQANDVSPALIVAATNPTDIHE